MQRIHIPDSIFLSGKSGGKYRYWIYPLPAALRAEPGNYVLAKRGAKESWVMLYIGETEDLSREFDRSRVVTCAIENGATHIFVHQTHGGKAVRYNEKRDLQRNYDPPCDK